jgi:Cu/Ag efflux pump CusA
MCVVYEIIKSDVSEHSGFHGLFKILNSHGQLCQELLALDAVVDLAHRYKRMFENGVVKSEKRDELLRGILDQVPEDLRELAEQELPSNINMILLGEAEAYEETEREVMLTYILALIIVFLVLAAQFESINSALVVMATVPFGVAAAFFAIYITGTSINIFSQIGLVMLIGLIAKNSILLVEFADQLRDQGKSVREAVEQAATIRLRPIMMTLVSTLLGALPLILSVGAGAEARNAIGWVIFGGLAFAVVFTLYLTPIVYYGLARFSKPRADETQKLEREMQAADML